ncbi:interleukin-10 receptor subunit alpha isoform X2 [Melanerpes formicivorus]|uniref:interleukin-10 receptor subunit alpha isoform X2 n=1 Tax=Melanerpes formicivorus TaxID=211600 RepID=UPI00358EC9D1
MAPSTAALALCMALLLARPAHGEGLAQPTDVRFEAEIGHHLLRWGAGHNAPGHVQYQVEHKVYGTNVSWAPIPTCMNISGHSCDLTFYTLDPDHRYYARVRAVAGNLTSPWHRTNSFSPREAKLCLGGQSLSVRGNTIHMQLQLLLRVGNLSIRYEEIQQHARRYWVHVRRTQDNWTYNVLETSPEFNISSLWWDTQYCISVEPEVASRNTKAARTQEQCITTHPRDRSSELVLIVGSSFFITFLLLALLGVLLLCTYLKKPVRPPSVLKSFMKQSSLWMEESSSSLGSPDPIQQLFLCQKEPQQDCGPTSSTGTAQLPLEEGWRLPAWPEDQMCLLGLGAMGSRDSSCTSTDSGICLHTSSSSSQLSCSSSPEPQGYKQQEPPSDDSGVGLGTPGPTPCWGSGQGSPTEARLPHGQELSLCPAASQDCGQDVEFRGYLQQSKGRVEPRQEPAEGLPSAGGAGPPQGSSDTALDLESSELAVVKGYLKQTSPEHPHSHLQDLAPWRAPWGPTAWDLSSQVGPQAPRLLSYEAPGAPLASKAGPELLKSPFDLSTFNTDLLGTLPLISSLSTSKWLGVQMSPLSLLSGGSKDSRL